MNSIIKNIKRPLGKMYYSISEVAGLVGVEQHVLRYWESEFSKLKPKKNRAGNRQYRDKDIKIIRYIKHLLHNDMYTVQGAKKKLSESGYKEVEGQLDLLSSFAKIATTAEQISEAKAQKSREKPESETTVTNKAIPTASHKVLTEIANELKEVVKLFQ